MSAATYFVILMLSSSIAMAQIDIGQGQVMLRGQLIKSASNAQLVINPEMRNMLAFDLSSSVKDIPLDAYKSGTYIEACVIVQKKDADSLNRKANALKLRPLGPKEPIIVYSTQIPVCDVGAGCKHFGEKIPVVTSMSKGILFSDLPADFYKCR